MNEDHEWELVKENVQPLREGRTVSSITKGLHSDQKDVDFIKEHQRAFELELRTYDGDDPLDVWYRYIKWIEQHFPKGGQEGHLAKLIEKCLQKFQTEELYANDPRLIKLWIMFSNFSESPSDVYAYMFDNGIGVKVSQLYIEWATMLEIAGNTKRADSIYTEGINRLAEPKDLLLQKQQQFQIRVAKNITLQIGDKQKTDEESHPDEKREVLSRLKPASGGLRVGTTRTGAINLGSAGKLRDQREPVAPKQVQSKGFAIFTDENNPTQPQQTKEWVSMPTRSVASKENDRKPGVWTNAKLRQGPVVHDTATSGHESFKIHEDPAECAPVTPMKTTVMNHKPLSAVKAPQHTDALSTFRQGQNVPNLNEGIPMYPKDKIYQGMEEFSFEELRAIQHWKKVEVAKKEEERNKREAALMSQVEAQAHELQAQASRLEMQANRLASFEALLQSHLTTGGVPRVPNDGRLEEQMDQLQLQSSETHSSVNSAQNESSTSQSSSTSSSFSKRNTVSSRQNQFSKKMEEAGMVPEANASNEFITPTNLSSVGHSKLPSSLSTGNRNNTSQRTPIFNSLSTYSSLGSSGGSGGVRNSLSQSGGSSIKKSRLETTLGQMSRSSLSSDLTGEVQATSGGGSGGRNRMPISAPSPTVCTREAVQLVQGMYCAELGSESLMEQGTEEDFENPVPLPAAKFQICQDVTEERVPLKQPGPTFQPASTDKENSKFDRQSFHVLEDVEMADMDRGHLQDFTIAQAREDMTIAPLSNFSIKACAASTPFNGIYNKNNPKATESMESEVSLPSCPDHTAQSVGEGAPSPYRHLSPIFEGSGEGSSNNESSAKSQSHVSTDSTLCAKNLLPNNQTGTSARDVIQEEEESPIVEGSGAGSSNNNSSTKSQSIVSSSQKNSSMRDNVQEEGRKIPEREEEEEGSFCDDQPLDATCHHIIDTSACQPEETEALLSATVSIQDPYDLGARRNYLSRLQPPLSSYENFHEMDETINKVSENDIISVGEDIMEMIAVDKSLGKGGYAQVFRILKQSIENLDTQMYEAMKVEKPPCYWEFYIATEIQRRLVALHSPMDVRPSVMSVSGGYFNPDLSLLVMKLMEKGSLLDLVNLYRVEPKLMGQVEPFVCLVAVELLHLFEQLHKCDIVHGDVKPDNFLLMDLPSVCDSSNPRDVFGSALRVFCLTDFGQSIDLHMFPKGTSFKTPVKTNGFQCIEMRTDRPWTFQSDLFGLAGTIHVLLFGSYMKVFTVKGAWKTTGNFARKWNVPLWKKFFDKLLNIPFCDCQPDLASLRAEFEDYFCSSLVQPYNEWVAHITPLLQRAC